MRGESMKIVKNGIWREVEERRAAEYLARGYRKGEEEEREEPEEPEKPEKPLKSTSKEPKP